MTTFRPRLQLVIAESGIDPARASLIVLLTWIASIDESFDPTEKAVLVDAGILGADVPIELEEIGTTGSSRNIALALSLLRNQMDSEQKAATLDLCIGMALADRVLRYAEIHAVELVADALGIGVAEMRSKFLERTGRAFPKPSDPSRREHWDRDDRGRQEQDGGESGKGERGSRRQQRTADSGGRVGALATLGLTGDSTKEEIKAAYRRLAMVHHPDRFAKLGPDAAKAAEHVFLRIQAAYELLIR